MTRPPEQPQLPRSREAGEGGRESKRLARLERDLSWVLDLLEPANPACTHLDPWGDERAYIYTAREAVRRVKVRLSEHGTHRRLEPPQ